MNRHAKGVRFEREVADEFTAAGFTVRGLESGGDHFAVSKGGDVLAVECKRQERLKLHEWLRQQDEDCPEGARRVLVFRRNREQAYAVVPFDQFLRDEKGRAHG